MGSEVQRSGFNVEGWYLFEVQRFSVPGSMLKDETLYRFQVQRSKFRVENLLRLRG